MQLPRALPCSRSRVAGRTEARHPKLRRRPSARAALFRGKREVLGRRAGSGRAQMAGSPELHRCKSGRSRRPQVVRGRETGGSVSKGHRCHFGRGDALASARLSLFPVGFGRDVIAPVQSRLGGSGEEWLRPRSSPNCTGAIRTCPRREARRIDVAHSSPGRWRRCGRPFSRRIAGPDKGAGCGDRRGEGRRRLHRCNSSAALTANSPLGKVLHGLCSTLGPQKVRPKAPRGNRLKLHAQLGWSDGALTPPGRSG